MLPDDTDERIVQLLSRNADLTYKEIGGKLKLNESTVRKRVLALRRRGVIKGILVDVDEEKIGYNSRVMLGVDVDPSKMIDVGRKLSAIPEARMVFNTTGGHNFQVVIWTKDRDSLSRLLNRIGSIDGVTKTSPSFIVEVLK